MAHFAQLDENNIVQQVIVVANATIGGGNFPESEAVGQQFIASLGLAGEWKQTSYSASFRSKYAGIGDRYDAELDEFVTPESDQGQ
jgi:hypothetical protein